jgi:WD40 repeat protein
LTNVHNDPLANQFELQAKTLTSIKKTEGTQMKDEQTGKQPEHGEPDSEKPKIYSIKKRDGKWMLSRKSFLEAVSATVGCAALGGLGGASADAGESTKPRISGMAVRAHSKAVRSLAISPDGKWLVSGGEEGKLKLWTLPEGALAKSLDSSASSLDALAFSSDGIFLVSGSSGYSNENLKLWRYPDLKEERAFRAGRTSSSLLHLAISPDNASVASAGGDKRLRLWSIPEGKLLSASETDLAAAPLKVVFAADGKHLLGLDGSERLPVLSIPELRIEKRLPIDSKASEQPAPSTPSDLSELELRAAKGDAEAQYQLGSDFRFKDTVEAYKWLRLAVDNGCWKASREKDSIYEKLSLEERTEAARRLQLFRAAAERQSERPPGFVCLATTSDGRTVIAGRKNGIINFISFETGKILRELKGHMDAPNALAITNDGKMLASAGDDKDIKLWSIPGGELLKTLTGHTQKVNALAIRPDGKLLASGSDDKTIRLWTLPDGKELLCLMDLDANYKTAEGITYKAEDQSGQVITYTLPCGSPIPPGAVCVCNCVPGSLTIPSVVGPTYYVAPPRYVPPTYVAPTYVPPTYYGGYSYYVSYWYPN